LGADPPIFARSVFTGTGPHRLLDAAPAAAHRQGKPPDRVTPLLAAIAPLAPPFSQAWFEYPDTNEGKALSTLSRALGPRVDAALTESGALVARAHARLHVFLTDGATAYVGTSAAATGARWPMGIARLHMPRQAPSRSVLKLVEALAAFLGERELTLMRAGLRAVDLGAAPGGWTWLLAQRGLRVQAVDNGALTGPLLDEPLVTHVREDGLSYRPRRPVDWLTCDIVEQPARIAGVVAGWIADGDARRAIFNLKLPMKKRYDEVQRCKAIIGERLTRAGVQYELAIRQLYHDREEVTAYLARND
jgi:23S rRNA (cytidine2498-2'-O)-methyltransferase